MALNLNDNKRPYFKQLGLDETFDEIQSAVNAIPSPSYVEVAVTSAQLKTIGSAPLALLPSGGLSANQYYDLNKVILEFTYVAPAYTLSDAHLFIGTTDNNYAGSWIGKNVIASSVNKFAITTGFSPLNVIGSYTEYADEVAGQGIYLGTLGANPATGNGTLLIKLWYNIRTIGVSEL
jgi:hypothetical protein